MRGVGRLVAGTDVWVALGFVLAAAAEAVLRYRDTPGLLALDATGALWLGALAVRRSRPAVTLCVISGAGVLGSVLTVALWPDATDGAGVWILAMVLACYSLGAHGTARSLPLGLLLPLAVVVASDATTRSGWDRINGMLFVSVFVGLLPTVVGGLVRARNVRLDRLRQQAGRIESAQRAERESAVLAERLRTVERLQPTLLDGLDHLAAAAETGADPAVVESSARALLTRTREEVLALTRAPARTAVPGEPVGPAASAVDHVRALRHAAQPWTVVAAGALLAGLVVETSWVLAPGAPSWAVVAAALVAAAPLSLAWWRPVPAVALAWLGVAAYSHLVAPLHGSLSETAFALATAFAVAALSHRRTAVVGLLVCWVGQLAGVGTGDPLGEGVLLLLAWLGGLSVNEVSRLVEQTRANNELLARQEAAAGVRAVLAERLRLAREIHDALGHSLTVVTLQAGAARRLAGSDPDQAREVMRTVAAAARSGVTALAAEDAAADLGGLVERVRATGLRVDTDLADDLVLDPAQRVVALRVVQEGLTNVLRHAPGARATITVRRHAEGVEVAVVNTEAAGPGTGPGTGRGLAGIRERVESAAGRASWRDLEDGGFEVRALLPWPEAAPAAPSADESPGPPLGPVVAAP